LNFITGIQNLLLFGKILRKKASFSLFSYLQVNTVTCSCLEVALKASFILQLALEGTLERFLLDSALKKIN